MLLSLISVLPLWLNWLSPVAPTPPMAAKLAPAPALAWSASRPLSWADFQAQPGAPSNIAALTSANISVNVGCTDFKFNAAVKAVFTPSESWVREPGKAKPELLRHEQAHFDLTEVHARQMRQKLALMQFDCDKLQPALNNYTKVAFMIWQRDMSRYDQETNHGLNAERQQQWEAAVKQRLEKLSAYALPE
ncbi:DUF922 domain-containing protein [Hymenobacter guriensis]|uniref:DUF922 domain-containing protein n=1 Tax=Hymenobacter guriensis TaxID=2793065 RepID=A0ABS0KW40_9BACT|nr:DUF922 domain-containing protein [Hymenobacter guriensis]MBG8551985.1 DUF922 domain-containing protein [Hymenobacter guriensis]